MNIYNACTRYTQLTSTQTAHKNTQLERERVSKLVALFVNHDNVTN